MLDKNIEPRSSGSIIFVVGDPTTNIIEPYFLKFIMKMDFLTVSKYDVFNTFIDVLIYMDMKYSIYSIFRN